MPLGLLSGFLWDLRAQCEAQVRALTDAQRQLDVYRDSVSPQLQEAALAALTGDVERVLEANRSVRESAEQATAEISRLVAERSQKP
jgi:hypothetical protein